VFLQQDSYLKLAGPSYPLKSSPCSYSQSVMWYYGLASYGL